MMNCADLRSPFIAWLRMLVAMASFLVMGVPSGLVAIEPSLRMTGSESCDSKYSSIVICSCVLFCFAMLCCVSIIPSKSGRGLLSPRLQGKIKAEGFPNSSAPNQIINIFDNHEKRIFTFTLTGFLSVWEGISRPYLYILLLTAHWSASEQVSTPFFIAYTLRRKRNVRSYRLDQ